MPENRRALLQTSFVLHSRPYRETSALIDIFSREAGKVSLVAKGVRKRGSNLSAVLRPFTPLRISWSGRSQLATLTAAEIVPPGIQLAGRSLFCGFYLNELLVRFLQDQDPHQDLFSYYAATLLGLNEEKSIENALRYFELALLEETGFGLQIDREADSGGPIVHDKTYAYEVGCGVVSATASQPIIHGSTLIALQQRNLQDPVSRREAKCLMRGVIDYHLNGKNLLSRALFPLRSGPAPDLPD